MPSFLKKAVYIPIITEILQPGTNDHKPPYRKVI